MPEIKELQMSLPYQEITEVVNRVYLRENFDRSEQTAYKIPFGRLKIREGFNKRLVYDRMDELAASIKIKGLIEPLTVDILPDGTVYIEKGHRRHRALQMLIDSGEVIDTVPCYVNSKSVTEFERMENIYNSNMYSSRLKPIEQANVAFALKYNFGKELSNESIAEGLGVSRQKVDYLIKIAQSPDDIKNQIMMADMSMSDAIALINKQKKSKKESDKAELDANKNSAGKTPLPYDPNAEELAELELLEKQAAGMEEKDEEASDARISTYDPDVPHETKPLDLVGNSVVTAGERKESDGNKKYDENRIEIQQQNNCISLNDRIAVRVEKLDISAGDKKDILDWLQWQMKDLLLNRDWIHANKKENKRGR